ncbi:MAG: sensor histidine kinase KdpD [Deltaproteobacteria bacterium]|nr:sensor histidine kinase KdpD [Deltaproteobacteria bacterium]
MPDRTPDELLSAIHKEEAQAKRGRLKVFFGMSAGVGKTFEMLTQAHREKKAGVDVVVGVVETHKREETEALIQGLPSIPKKKIEYRGTTLDEMDLDAILARRPKLVLVDELAHTNAPGSRHEKRYQDVLDILEAGIDVYTTLNVQHIESRIDTVKTITGVSVRETVPDSVLDLATNIELIDIPPDLLLQRLSEGKVYLGEKAEQATKHFFQKGSLTALRELALRLTAERVDRELLEHRREKQIISPWKTVERLMVAVGASPSSEQLIRWTRRTASNLEARWVAVYVETDKPLIDEDKATLTKNLALAEELGAEIVTTSDTNVTRALLRVAQQRNITQIVVGKPVEGYLRKFLGDGSPVNQLIRESGDIDIYVVQGSKGVGRKISSLLRNKIYSPPRQYFISALAVISAVIIGSFLRSFVGYSSIGFLFLFSILVQSLLTGFGPTLMAATLSALLYDFIFIPPYFTFSVSKPSDVMLLLIFFVVAVVTGLLASRTRSRERSFQRRETHATALYHFSRELAETSSLNDVAEKISRGLGGLFSTDTAVYIRTDDYMFPDAPHPKSHWIPEQKERSIAHWVFENRQMAGRFTNTLRDAAGIHLPLIVADKICGVLSIRPRRTRVFTIDELALLEAFSNSAALAIEKELMSMTASKAKSLEESQKASQKLHKVILNSVSHELRTPLTAISGSASALLEEKIASNKESRRLLVTEIILASDRLGKLVENLLDMSRLESGHLKPKMSWIDVGDLISVVANEIKDPRSRKRISTAVSPDLPLLFADFVLMEQVLSNLTLNALTHTSDTAAIRISAGRFGNFIQILVEDEGPGLDPADLPQVFEKFYRASHSKPGGTGLGLSICKGFIEAQNGKIRAENREKTSGARFIIEMPIKEEANS